MVSVAPTEPETESEGKFTLSDNDTNTHVTLTPEPLNLRATAKLVRSSRAGAIVMFAGTTRESAIDDDYCVRSVAELTYSAYTPLALTTLFKIACRARDKHELTGIAITHRIGTVAVGEESIHVAVSSPHRPSAWAAGAEALEEVKLKAEIWKKEVFSDGAAVWRANVAPPSEDLAPVEGGAENKEG